MSESADETSLDSLPQGLGADPRHLRDKARTGLVVFGQLGFDLEGHAWSPSVLAWTGMNTGVAQLSHHRTISHFRKPDMGNGQLR